jgi:Zn-dependent peptidase ImmA (M78 family)
MHKDIIKIISDTLIYYNVLDYPIDPFLLAMRLGIKICPYSKLSNRGFELSKKYSKDGFSCVVNNDEWHIYYNDKAPNQFRMRYTLFHEIGHFVLGHIKTNSFEEEIEANNFSRNILVPNVLVYYWLGENVSVKLIQEKFLTSMEVAKYAYESYKKWLYKFKRGEIEDYELELVYRVNLNKLVA